MLRKLLLSALLAAGTVTGIALTPAAAEARPPWSEHDRHDYRHNRFEVLYLDCGHWKNSGTFRDREDAERAAHRLRSRGFAVRIERC
jgi:hypothetical protein